MTIQKCSRPKLLLIIYRYPENDEKPELQNAVKPTYRAHVL